MTSPFASRRRFATLALAAAAALGSAAAGAVPIVGLTTTNALALFDSATPNAGSTLATITGLALNERILDIDLRPTTGVLYGISDASRVYSLTTAGAATLVGTLATPLAGSVTSIDFNPVADLNGATSLRVVSSTGQNLAFNVATGATAVQTPVMPSFASVAYANNDINPATATALYYIDSAADVLRVATAAFDNPNITTVGALGFNANGVSGFDIYGDSTAFASLTDADSGKSGVYSINLGTGAATFIGAFGIGGNTAIAPPLLGLTVAAIAPIPEPSTYAFVMVGLAAVGLASRKRRRA